MSNRCTVWVTIKQSDIEKHTHNDDFQDFLGGAAEQSGNESWAEFTFEDVRYPDDLCEVLGKLNIPYKSVNSDGEYPEGLCVRLPSGQEAYAQLNDGDPVVTMDRSTGVLDERMLEHAKTVIAFEREFDEYLKGK